MELAGIDEDRVTKFVAYAYWVWLIGPVISVVSGVSTLILTDGNAIAVFLLVLVCVQAAIAIPAALALRRRRANWARITLLVLALLTLASLYQTVQMQDWVSVVFSLALGSTLGVLMDKHVVVACKTR